MHKYQKSLRNIHHNKNLLHIQTDHNVYVSLSPTYSPRTFMQTTHSSPASPYSSHSKQSFKKTVSVFHTKRKKRQMRLPSPSLEDKEMLTTYYKSTQEDEQKYHTAMNSKGKLTKCAKNAKQDLLKRYRIVNKFDYSHDKDLPMLTDNNMVSINIKKPYFKSYTKAKKTLQINEQLVNTIAKLSHYMQVKTYGENIKKQTQVNEAIDKMPHVRVKKTEGSNIKLDPNEHIKGGKRKSVSLACFIKKGLSTKHASSQSSNGIISLYVRNISNVNITYGVSSYKRAYKPTSRAMFTLNMYKHKLYLFGGLNSIYNNDMWIYSIHSKKWEELKQNQEHPIPRYGHSSVQINEYLIIYGGQIPDNYYRIQEDVLLFNMNTNTFTEHKLLPQKKPAFRKGHIALAICQTMLIHGGIETDSDYITNHNSLRNDAFIYHLSKSSWSELETNGENLPYLAYHSGVFVNNFSLDNPNAYYSVYKLPENLPSNRVKRTKMEGIFLFGGVNDRKKFNNELYIIKICRKPCKVVKPNVKGIPPKGRINCKLLFIQEYNMVIVHGGCGEKQEVLNDIMILNLEHFDWLRPRCESPEGPNSAIANELKCRTEHDVFIVNGKLFILGGRNADNYLKMDFEIVSFSVSE